MAEFLNALWSAEGRVGTTCTGTSPLDAEWICFMYTGYAAEKVVGATQGVTGIAIDGSTPHTEH